MEEANQGTRASSGWAGRPVRRQDHGAGVEEAAQSCQKEGCLEGQELSTVHKGKLVWLEHHTGGGVSHGEVRGRLQRALGTSAVRVSERKLLMGS